MDLDVVENLTLYGDNEISINLTRNVESQYRTKHIDVQHHYIRELVNKEEFTVKWILSFDILTDKMTKVLSIEIFQKYWALLEMTVE